MMMQVGTEPVEVKGILLEAENLCTSFFVFGGEVKAIQGVSLKVAEREIVGLVGETGCGKSVTAFSIPQLIRPPGKIVAGQVRFRGVDLLKLRKRELRHIRGQGISMIFQRPMSSLDPVFRIGQQLLDVISMHQEVSKKRAREIARDSLVHVAIPEVDMILRRYPHELSGGMQQRVMIAMALSCNSSLLIADEPTTALDVSVQLQVLKLLAENVRQRMSILLISHNMGIIASMCNRVYVMYSGGIVEEGPTGVIVGKPAHPYTKALIRAVPHFDQGNERLEHLKGDVPDPIFPPPGCRLHPRCPIASEECKARIPPLVEVGEDHFVACFKVKREDQNSRDKKPLKG